MASTRKQQRAREREEHARERQHIASTLGPDIARRVGTFDNGLMHVESTTTRQLLAWLIDVTVVFGTTVLTTFLVARDKSSDFAPAALALFLVLLLGLPFVYGWCFRNGRALGGVVTSTRLVRVKDGGRIGWGKAGWAMFVRTFYLPVAVVMLFAALEDGFDFAPVRTSIDAPATARLWAAGFVWQRPVP